MVLSSTWLEETDGASILGQFVSEGRKFQSVNLGTHVSFQVLAVVPTEELEEPEREDRGQGMVAFVQVFNWHRGRPTSRGGTEIR